MATPKKKPTVRQSKPRAKTRQPATAAAGDCNPCFEQSAGLLTCDGSGVAVVPFPSGGPWIPFVKDGVLDFANGAGLISDPQPAPADPELDPPDDEPMPPAPAPE